MTGMREEHDKMMELLKKIDQKILNYIPYAHNQYDMKHILVSMDNFRLIRDNLKRTEGSDNGEMIEDSAMMYWKTPLRGCEFLNDDEIYILGDLNFYDVINKRRESVGNE